MLQSLEVLTIPALGVVPVAIAHHIHLGTLISAVIAVLKYGKAGAPADPCRSRNVFVFSQPSRGRSAPLADAGSTTITTTTAATIPGSSYRR